MIAINHAIMASVETKDSIITELSAALSEAKQLITAQAGTITRLERLLEDEKDISSALHELHNDAVSDLNRLRKQLKVSERTATC